MTSQDGACNLNERLWGRVTGGNSVHWPVTEWRARETLLLLAA